MHQLGVGGGVLWTHVDTRRPGHPQTGDGSSIHDHHLSEEADLGVTTAREVICARLQPTCRRQPPRRHRQVQEAVGLGLIAKPVWGFTDITLTETPERRHLLVTDNVSMTNLNFLNLCQHKESSVEIMEQYIIVNTVYENEHVLLYNSSICSFAEN